MGKGEMIYDIGGGEGERHRHKDITLYKARRPEQDLGQFCETRAHKFEVGSEKSWEQI